MNKSYNLAYIILGYTVIEAVSLATALVASFFTWGMMLDRPDGTTPGDGFGYLIILMIGSPICIIIAILSPLIAHRIFPEPLLGRFKRIAFSFVIPVLTSVITAAVITLFLEAS